MLLLFATLGLTTDSTGRIVFSASVWLPGASSAGFIVITGPCLLDLDGFLLVCWDGGFFDAIDAGAYLGEEEAESWPSLEAQFEAIFERWPLRLAEASRPLAGD